MLLHQFNFQSPYNKLLFCYINKRQKKIDPFKTFFVLQGKYKDRVLKEETFFASNGVNHIPIQQHFFDFIHDPEDFFTEFVCYSDLKYDKYFTANLFYSKYSRNLSNLIQTHSFNFFKLAKVLDNLKLKSRSRSVYTRIRFLSKKTFSYFSIITYWRQRRIYFQNLFRTTLPRKWYYLHYTKRNRFLSGKLSQVLYFYNNDDMETLWGYLIKFLPWYIRGQIYPIFGIYNNLKRFHLKLFDESVKSNLSWINHTLYLVFLWYITRKFRYKVRKKLSKKNIKFKSCSLAFQFLRGIYKNIHRKIFFLRRYFRRFKKEQKVWGLKVFDFFDIDVELEEYDMVKGLFLDSKIPRNLTKLFFSFKKFSSNLYSVIRQTNYSEVEYDLEYRYDYFYLKILLMRFYTLIKRQQKFYFTRFPGENIIKLISDKQINVDCYFESFPRMRFQHENSRSFRLAFTLNKTASFVPSFFLMPTSFSVNNIFLNLVPDQNKMIEFLDFVKNIFQTNLINVLRQEQFFDKAIENIFLKIDLNKILTTFIKKKKKYLKLKSNFSLKRYKKQKPLIKSLIRKRRLKAKERFRFYRNLPRVIKRWCKRILNKKAVKEMNLAWKSYYLSCLLRKSFVHVKFSKRGILKKNRASLIDEKPCLFEFETQFIEKKYKLKKSRVTCFKFSKKKSRAISLKFSKKKSRLISSKSSKKKKMFLSLKNKRLKYIRSRLVKNYPLKKKSWIIKKKINTLNINNIFNVYQSTFTKYLLKNRLFKNLYLEVSYRRIKFLRFKTLQKFVRQKYKNWWKRHKKKKRKLSRKEFLKKFFYEQVILGIFDANARMKKSDYVKDDILFAVIPEREKRGSEWKHFAQFKKNILLNKNVIKFPVYEKTNKLLRNQNFNNLLESTKVNHSLRLVSFKRFKYFNLKQRKWLSNRVKVQEHSERYLSILEVIRPSAKSLKGMRKVWKFKIKIAKMKRKKRKAFYKAKRKQFYKAKRKHFHKWKFKHFHNSKSKLIPSRRKWFKKKNENNKKLIVKEPLKKYYLVDDKLIVK